MSKQRTLLIVAPYFPPHSGGLERYAFEVARELGADKEWKVVVLTTSENARDEVTNVQGITTYRLSYRFKLSNTPWSFGWLFKALRVMRSVAPDIVNVHTPVPGLGDVAALFTPRTVPLVVTYHAGSMRKGVWYLDLLIGAYERTALRYMLRKARRIVCTSEHQAATFLARYRDKSTVISPAVDHTLFRPSDVVCSEPAMLFVPGGLNRADAYKGLDTLLSAMPDIMARVPDARLTVLGDGDMRQEYERMADAYGVRDAVTFAGRLSREEVAGVYRAARVFVLPTRYDNAPTAVLEAMASGVPVVSTRVGAIPSFVSDTVSGYVIEPDDRADLIARCAELLTNERHARKMGAAGREEVLRAHTWEMRGHAYRTLLSRALFDPPVIAHVVAYYPPHVGGMEVVAHELTHRLAGRGFMVRVFTSALGAAGEPRTVRGPHFLLRRLRAIEIAHTPVIWSLPFRLLALPRGTLVHVHLAQALVPELALIAAKVRGFRIVGQFHLDVEPSGRLGWLFLWYKKHILPGVLRRMDGIMVFTEAQASLVTQLHGVPRERIHLVSNAVHEMFFREPRDTPPRRPVRILTVSRLTVQKRVDRLVEAMAHLTVPAELTVVGDGEDRTELERLAREKRLSNVRFVGVKTHAELCAYHEWADMFVIPSDKEGGMPLTALEAMAAGLPVVGADVLGVRELLEGPGLLVRDLRPEGFALALSELANDTARMKALSHASVNCAQRHTWEAATDGIMRVYTQVRV